MQTFKRKDAGLTGIQVQHWRNQKKFTGMIGGIAAACESL
jgi:hypothetical protein